MLRCGLACSAGGGDYGPSTSAPPALYKIIVTPPILKKTGKKMLVVHFFRKFLFVPKFKNFGRSKLKNYHNLSS